MRAHQEGVSPLWKQGSVAFYFVLFVFSYNVLAQPVSSEQTITPDKSEYSDDAVPEESLAIPSEETEKVGDTETSTPDTTVPSNPSDTIFADEAEATPSEEGVIEPSDKAVEAPAIEPLQIKSILFEGNNYITADVIDQKLNPLLPYTMKEPGLTGLDIFTRAITELYHEKGYILAQAYIPEQEIHEGTLKIAIMEGVLGGVTVSGNTIYPTSFIKNPFKEGAVITYSSFERSMLILNEYTDLTATGIFQPGATPGSADFLIHVKDQKQLHYSLDYDNYGSPFVSRHHFGVGLTAGNLIRYGDQMIFHGIVGSPVNDMYYGKINYGLPLGTNGTRFNISYAGGDSDIGKSLSDLNITMKSKTWDLSATHPYIKSRYVNLQGEMGLEGNDFRRSFGVIQLKQTDRTRLVHLNMDYSKLIAGGHQNSARFSLRQGLGELLGAMPDNDLDASRAGADNRFLKGVLEVGRVQKMNDLVSLILQGSVQFSSDPLVVSEQFSLGGPNSVRGYSAGEFLGDAGYKLSVEMHLSPLEQKERLQAVFFIDQGEGSLKYAPVGGIKKETLMGAGFGVRTHHNWGMKRNEQERPLSMDILADIGYPLQGGPTQKTDAAYYVQAIWRY